MSNITDDNTITVAEAANRLASSILAALPSGAPGISFRAACTVVAEIAAILDTPVAGEGGEARLPIDRPPPELGLCWLDAATHMIPKLYEGAIQERQKA